MTTKPSELPSNVIICKEEVATGCDHHFETLEEEKAPNGYIKHVQCVYCNIAYSIYDYDLTKG